MPRKLFIIALALLPLTALADYQPLEPLPIPGLSGNPSFPAVMAAAFQLAMIAGAVLAVLMITYGGIQYMTSDVLGTKDAGRSRIKNAVLGFLLLLAIYLILYTINPDLLNFDLRSISQINAPFTTQTPSGSVTTNNTNTTVPASAFQTGGPCAPAADGSVPGNCLDPNRYQPVAGVAQSYTYDPAQPNASKNLTDWRKACTAGGGFIVVDPNKPGPNGGNTQTCQQAK